MPFEVRARRWWTPKRCCSSTMEKARFLKLTPSWKRVCVPMSRFMVPDSKLDKISLRDLPLSLPVRMEMLMPIFFARGASVWKCWRARSSVGAMKATCPPDSMTEQEAMKATMVLPEPTSPCRRRIMRSVLDKSVVISSMLRCWAAVKVKGIWVVKRVRRLLSPCQLRPPLRFIF